MRAFLAFTCILAVASARPDVSLGYRYPQPGGGSSGSLTGLLTPGSSFAGSVGSPSGFYAPSFSGSSGGPGVSFSSGFSQQGSAPGLSVSGFSSHGNGGVGGGFSSVPSFGGSSFHGSGAGLGGAGGFGSDGHGFGGAGGHGFVAPIITKHFYLHAAPEEHQDQLTQHITIGRPQKNYRVVFVKAPASSSVAPRITASFAPNEEKTVIYVLAKKPDAIQINDIAQPAPTEPSKPEVFFIKYKTPQEAAHAQQQIQAQYDALGGSSQVTDEGTAPVSSVIGSLGGDGGIFHDGSGTSLTGSKYLPPNH